MILGSAWLLITANAHLLPLLYVAEICNAASLALISGALDAEYLDRCKRAASGIPAGEDEVLGAAISYSNRVQFRSRALCAGAGGVIYGWSPYATWTIGGLMAVLSGILFLRAARRAPTSRDAVPRHAGPSIPGTSIWKVIKTSHRGLLLPIAVSGLLYASFQVAIQYWQISLTDAGAGSGRGLDGLIFGAIFVMILLAQSTSGRAQSFIGSNPRRLAIAIAIPPALWAVSIHMFGWVLIAGLVIVYFWLYRSADVVVDVFLNLNIVDEVRATVIPARSTIARAVTLACAPAVSFSVREWGGAGAVYMVVLLAMPAALGIYVVYRNNPRRSHNTGTV